MTMTRSSADEEAPDVAVMDDLERGRAALQMINPAPYNAEAPPEALAGEITPDRSSTTSAATSRSRTTTACSRSAAPWSTRSALTLDDLRALPKVERAVTLECAGNGRLAMRPLPTGEPWGDYAVSTARWGGALLHEVLAQARPAADGVDVRFEGADHGAYHLSPILPDTKQDDLTFVRALPARPGRRSGRGDPHRLRDERRAAGPRPRRTLPDRRAALVRRRVREVADSASTS